MCNGVTETRCFLFHLDAILSGIIHRAFFWCKEIFQLHVKKVRMLRPEQEILKLHSVILSDIVSFKTNISKFSMKEEKQMHSRLATRFVINETDNNS